MHFTFGIDGNVAPCLGPGWAAPEAGFTWTQGVQSRLRLPVAPGVGQLTLEIGVKPFLAPPALPVQRLIITCNSVTVAEESVGNDASLGFHLPASCGGPVLDLVLACPDAVAPRDVGLGGDARRLGFAVNEILLLWAAAPRSAAGPVRAPLPAGEAAVRAATGLGLAALGGAFASLGRNCEFGIAQRRMGAEPMGLLRFASVPPARLIAGLDLGFEGIEDAANLSIHSDSTAPGTEYLVRDRRHGLQLHTNILRGTMAEDEVMVVSRRTLGFLQRKLVEELQIGEKIWVFQNVGTQSVAQARPLINVLRSHGPNALLFVTEGGPHPPGTVVQEDDDLFHGHVARLAPHEDVSLLDLDPWISVCANAYALRFGLDAAA